MKDLGKTAVSTSAFVGDVLLKLWEAGDPFPTLGPSVGIDTETELITATLKDPPVVVMGVFDAPSSTCWVVMWQHVAAFMKQLCVRDIEQRYFRAGYDRQVLDNEDEDQSVLFATDKGRVRDMQIRVHLKEIATIGWIRHNLYSLAGCALHYLNCTLDKGDPDDPDNSVRLSFKRYNEDGSLQELTLEQLGYLALDCVSTWGLGEVIEEQPTEVVHTQGALALEAMSRNGIHVDPKVYDTMEAKLKASMDEARLRLLQFGFPDPYRDADKERDELKNFFYSEYKKLCALGNLEPELFVEEYENEDGEQIHNPTIPKKTNLKMMICYLYNFSEDPAAVLDCVQSVKYVCENPDQKINAEAKRMYDTLAEKHEFLAFDESRKRSVLPTFVGAIMAEFVKQADNGYVKDHGFDFDTAVENASMYMDEHPEWMAEDPPMGPSMFFQKHVQGLLDSNPDLELERTEKSGKLKLTRKDTWKLEDLGIEDKFLDAYTTFGHCQNYLSTYLNRKHLTVNNTIHTRFTNLLRTGRTSSTRPNIQNIPARDTEFPLRLMYKAYPGTVLCATDFSFVELCGFAQACYTRFGHSVMRTVINAGLDPHRWFAGVMDKLITPDLSGASDPTWLKDMKILLKTNVSDAARQKAKAANFGSEDICFSYLT